MIKLRCPFNNGKIIIINADDVLRQIKAAMEMHLNVLMIVTAVLLFGWAMTTLAPKTI